MKICSTCGGENSSNAKFCKHCGDKLKRFNIYQIGSLFVMVGAALSLLLKIYRLLIPGQNPYSVGYLITSSIFGHWLGHLLFPPQFEFHFITFIYLPWSAINIVFVFWIGFKIYNSKASYLIYNFLFIIGLWFFVNEIYTLYGIYRYISKDIFNFNIYFSSYFLSDLIFLSIFSGICIILFQYLKQLKTK